MLLKAKHGFLVWGAVLNHYKKYFPTEFVEDPPVSPGEKKPKKKDNLSGHSGRSPHPSPSKGRTRVKDEDRGIVESSPLVDLDKIVKEPLDELGVSIDPDPMFHAIRLKYLFGANEKDYQVQKTPGRIQNENELYDKIIENLNPNWDKRRWAWPELKDPHTGFPVHFSIKMHENGRFIIPLKRDMNIKEFIYELSLVFSRFLSKEELEEFFTCLLFQQKNGHYFRREDGTYIHLAHKIGPEDVVDEKLNKASVKIRFIDYGRNPRVKVYVDKSKGPEIEGEFDNPEGKDLFDSITRGAIVAGNISGIHEQLNDVDSDLNYLMNMSSNSGQTLQLLQQKINTNHQDAISFLSEIEAHRYNSEITQDIHHADITKRLEIIKKQFPELKEMVSQFYSNQSSENKILRESLIKLIVSLLNFDTDHKNDLENQSSFLESKIEQVFLDTSSEIHNAKNETIKEIYGARDEIVQTLNDRFDSMSDIINKEFKSVRFRIKNALYLILRKLNNCPGMTVKSISQDLKVSQKTVYSYLKKLQDKDYITSVKTSSSGRGRPPKLFKLNRKKLFKIKKN
ncbi:MAG: winged helix-turn-helix transcriptional regulator [Promethearchaeota archaeon]